MSTQQVIVTLQAEACAKVASCRLQAAGDAAGPDVAGIEKTAGAPVTAPDGRNEHAFRATGRGGNDSNGATEPVATAPRLQPDAQRTL